MARHTSPLALYHTQVKRFAHLGMDMRRGHHDMALGGLDDWKNLTAGGVGPQGWQRTKWLRQSGHPYARGQVANSVALGGTHLRRSMSPKQAARAGMSRVPLLPIGKISGRLHRTIAIRNAPGGVQSFDVGTTPQTGKSAWAIVPGGTSKTVFRPMYDQVNKRWRARNKAFFDHFIKKQRQP